MTNLYHKYHVAKQAAFSLIEVLIVLVILALGILVIVSFHNNALRAVGVTQQQSYAVVLAEKKIAQLRHYTVLTTTAGASAYDDIVNGSEVVTSNNTSYTLTWLVTENTAPDYKVIKVTVNWTDATNQAQSMVLESFVGKIDVTKSGVYMQSL